jgi:hypothetical protein
MAMLNDPLPCAEPCHQAVRMAAKMRASVGELTAKWRKHGFELGFGIGIAYGYAFGRIGFEGRFDYAAIGAVPNLAARLCDEAKDGQILIDGKVKAAVEAASATRAARRVAAQRVSPADQGIQRPRGVGVVHRRGDRAKRPLQNYRCLFHIQETHPYPSRFKHREMPGPIGPFNDPRCKHCASIGCGRHRQAE